MSQDANNQQVEEKFSFIYTLTYSRSIALKTKPSFEDETARPSSYSLTLQSDSVETTSLILPSLATSTVIPQPQSLGQFSTSALTCLGQTECSANPQPKPKRRWLSKILFGCSCGYLLFVGWWLVNHPVGQFWLRQMQLPVASQKLSATEAEFLNYMERSLAAIERKTEDESLTARNSAPPPQIVYVPVITPVTHPAAVPTVSATAAATTPAIAKIPTPPPPPSELPTSESLPTPTTIKEPPPASKPATAAKVTNAASGYTLVGLLELGEQSVALVKVNGITKRIWLGDEIGSTGWMLDSITNQKAQVRRSGEVRSVSIGEQF